jgi:hypothetical protein
MYERWVFLASGLLLGSVATATYLSRVGLDDAQPQRIPLTDQDAGKVSARAPQDAEHQAHLNGWLASLGTQEVAPGRFAGDTAAMSRDGGRDVSGAPAAAVAPAGDDLRDAFPDLEPTPLARAERDQRVAEEEQLRAETERIHRDLPVDPALEAMPSEAELEIQRAQMEARIAEEHELALRVNKPEPLLPE